MNRRNLLAAAVGTFYLPPFATNAQESTPVLLQDAPWLSGSSATHQLSADLVAEPGTVQVVQVSPVLYLELAMILIHNATDHAVMLQSVRGTLAVPAVADFSQETGAYNVPDVIVPPNEYWIASLKVPVELSVGTEISFDAEVVPYTELPSINDITTLLTALPPDSDFEIPQSGEDWPIRYRNDAPYRAGQTAFFRQVFFDDSGEICGVVLATDTFDESGIAAFEMTPSNQPTVSTNGAVLGEFSDYWLAQWSHAPKWIAFEQFEFGE